ADARRIVIKLGSRVLVKSTGKPDSRHMRSLVRQIATLNREGREVVVVTSGAIGAGMEALGMKKRPARLPDLQMAAAVGQCRLMSRYDDLFASEACRVGQVLLTRANFQHKIRMTNARRTIENLLRHRVVPIINENDTVADEEIKADLVFGDNDLLSALLVKLIRADLLLLLTTVNGFLKRNASGRTQRTSYLESITASTFKFVAKSTSRLSTGGMRSKLNAAQIATKAGAAAVIADGRSPNVIARVMNGQDVGTIVVPVM
ncbi:unnamed protein product, partial [marine sediment metagenome]